MEFPGRLPGFRVIASSSAFPVRQSKDQWRALRLTRIRLADHSGGTAADLHGLSFFPISNRDTAGTEVFKERNNRSKLPLDSRRVNTGLGLGGGASTPEHTERSVCTRKVFVDNQPLAVVLREDVAAAPVDGVARPARAEFHGPIESCDRNLAENMNLRLGNVKL